MSTEQFDPSQYRFGKPNEAGVVYGKQMAVRVAKLIAERHSAALKQLREEVVAADSAELHWVSTVSALRALRKIDDDTAEGELHLLADAVFAGAPAARACRDVGVSPAAFKVWASRDTAAKVLLVPVVPKAGA